MTRRYFLALAASTRDDSIARMLEQTGLEYVLLRTGAAAVVAEHWEHSGTAAPLGSLVKPFVALAYGESHGFEYPRLECAGCWLPHGHGRIGIVSALSKSCNAYFLQLARLVNTGDIERTAARYGLPMPADTSPESLIGEGGKWRATPLAAALAFHELDQRRSEEGVGVVIGALHECARAGTAAALGMGAAIAAKTGTALCAHSIRAAGDGLLAAILPGYILIARAHGVTGAGCARRVAPFVRSVLS